MNVISKPARQALVGWGDQEEQGLSVNGVKPTGKLPLKMPINSEPRVALLPIQSSGQIIRCHRIIDLEIPGYICTYCIYIYTYTNIFVSLGCVPHSGKGIPS